MLASPRSHPCCFSFCCCGLHPFDDDDDENADDAGNGIRPCKWMCMSCSSCCSCWCSARVSLTKGIACSCSWPTLLSATARTGSARQQDELLSSSSYPRIQFRQQTLFSWTDPPPSFPYCWALSGSNWWELNFKNFTRSNYGCYKLNISPSTRPFCRDRSS